VLVAVAAVLLGACGSDSGTATDDAGSGGTAADGAFPVTIRHAFGETVVDTEPTRVLTWGWGSTDAAVALGVVPVAMPFNDYGADAEGVLPWVREALEDQGAEVPAVLPDSDDPPFEAIAAARPDLILAPYSGITENDYRLLSQIAPTVAYPGEAWATPWQETVRIVGTALGRAQQADELLADIDAAVAEAAAAHPELRGKTVAQVWDSAGSFYVYEPADPRVEFTEALGLVVAPSVEELATDESTFYFTLSYEQLGALTSDILVSYADTEDAARAFLGSSAAQLMPQVREGRVASVVGSQLIASVSPPTALSLTWGLDDYVAALSRAAEQVAAR
jgi:iron complex transport system substrate-binding protein